MMVMVMMMIFVLMFAFVIVSMIMPMPMPMRMHRMISLATFNRVTLLVCLHIPTLEEIIDYQHTSWPQSKLELPRTVHHVFKVMESEADGGDIEVMKFGAREVLGVGIGFVEKVAVGGLEGWR
jgi:hypothetical protein